MSPFVKRWIGIAVVMFVVVIVVATGTGMSAAVAAELVAAQIGPLGEHAVPQVVQLGEGMRAMLKAANEQDGAHGDRFSFVQFDDGGDPQRFVKRLEDARKARAIVILSPYGSPTVQGLLNSKALDTSDVVVINAVPGAEAFRKPGHPRLFHVRSGDGQQTERIVQQIRTLGMTRMAVIYVDSPGGYSELAAANESARRIGGLEVTGFKAGMAPASVAAAAAEVASSNTETISIFGPPPFLVDVIAALRRDGVAKPIFTLSYLTPDDLVPLGIAQSRGIAIVETLPNPMGVAMPLQREFQAAMKAAYPGMTVYTSFQLEGYVSARLFVEASRHAKHPTALDIEHILHAMGEVDLGGLRLDYSRGNVGSRFVDIGVITDQGRLKY